MEVRTGVPRHHKTGNNAKQQQSGQTEKLKPQIFVLVIFSWQNVKAAQGKLKKCMRAGDNT